MINRDYKLLSNKRIFQVISASENEIESSYNSFYSENKNSYSEKALLNKVSLQKPNLKVCCSVCLKDISMTIRVIGSSMKEYCFNCLLELKVNEDFHVIDKLDFSIFNTNWSLKEELELLTSIEKFGLDNWGEVSLIFQNKPATTCESHYYTYYLSSLKNVLPNKESVILDINQDVPSINTNKNKENQIKEEILKDEISKRKGIILDSYVAKDIKNTNRSRSLTKNRYKKENKTLISNDEISGYWPKREEFDVEFFNDAELDIGELEFFEDDTQEDIDLKLSVLQIYNMQLNEREERKR